MLTFFIYFGSEIFHPNYGIFHAQVPGTEDLKALCLVGWEWYVAYLRSAGCGSADSACFNTGGFRSSGNSSGPGSMRRTCSGRHETSMIRMDGACKLYCAALLGTLTTPHVLLITVAARYLIHICRLPASPLWLAGLYIPEMAPMNSVLFPPPNGKPLIPPHSPPPPSREGRTITS